MGGLSDGIEVGIRTMDQALMAANGLLQEVHRLQDANERLRAALVTDHVCRVCNDYLERDRDVCGVCYDALQAENERLKAENERLNAYIKKLEQDISAIKATRLTESLKLAAELAAMRGVVEAVAAEQEDRALIGWDRLRRMALAALKGGGGK